MCSLARSILTVMEAMRDKLAMSSSNNGSSGKRSFRKSRPAVCSPYPSHFSATFIPATKMLSSSRPKKPASPLAADLKASAF